MTRIVRLSQADLEKETNVKDVLGFSRPSTDEFLLRDDLPRGAEKQILGARENYQLFLTEYGITEEDVRAVTESGELFHLPMADIEIRVSAIQGYGLFAKRLIRAGENIAPAALNGYKTEAGRYTNHSDKPNAKMVVRDANNIDLVATREITTDYRETLRSRTNAL